MPILQEIIYKLEEGEGRHRLRKFLFVLAIIVFIVLGNWRLYKNFSTPEAMDSAQLARNIADGKGYTTLFIRPFSMYLVKRVNEKTPVSFAVSANPDYAKIEDAGSHPDVSNPPVYPLMLAGWMKVYHGVLAAYEWGRDISPGFIKKRLPQLDDSLQNSFWMDEPAHFSRDPRDFYLSVFNQILFFAVIVLVFFWAKKLFDNRVAWTSAAVLAGSEFLWQFSFSGLSTMLLLLIFMGLVWGLTLLDRELREPKWKPQHLWILAAAIGILTGLGGLTRYAFLWMIIPVLVFIILFGENRRTALALITFFAFAAVMTPWIIREYHLTHLPFGTATYTAFEDTWIFPGDHLQRALHPELHHLSLVALIRKLIGNLRGLFQNDLPTLGGTWVTVLFLAGLLIGFRNLAIRRIRYFVLMTLGLLIVVQALGRTYLSEETPTFNSENLLMLILPLVVVYGVSLFFILLDQMTLPAIELRFVIIGLFVLIACFPFTLSFLPPYGSPRAYPYNPPGIEKICGWMKPGEMIMTDMPWATAWYGQQQSIWLTLNADDDFFEINDYQKTISALYLTPLTTDKKFLSGWVMAGEKNWASFVVGALLSRQIPKGFPLTKSMAGLLPEQVFLTDWERWRQ